MKMTLVTSAVFAAALIGIAPALAQKTPAKPNLHVPCDQIRQQMLEDCIEGRTTCLKDGTPSSTCDTQYEQCTAEAESFYKSCEGGGAASTQPFLSLTPAPRNVSASQSQQTRSLLNALAN